MPRPGRGGRFGGNSAEFGALAHPAAMLRTARVGWDGAAGGATGGGGASSDRRRRASLDLKWPYARNCARRNGSSAAAESSGSSRNGQWPLSSSTTTSALGNARFWASACWIGM
jgi:hypothetical protein